MSDKGEIYYLPGIFVPLLCLGQFIAKRKHTLASKTGTDNMVYPQHVKKKEQKDLAHRGKRMWKGLDREKGGERYIYNEELFSCFCLCVFFD